jgi:hypothetical protein
MGALALHSSFLGFGFRITGASCRTLKQTGPRRLPSRQSSHPARSVSFPARCDSSSAFQPPQDTVLEALSGIWLPAFLHLHVFVCMLLRRIHTCVYVYSSTQVLFVCRHCIARMHVHVYALYIWHDLVCRYCIFCMYLTCVSAFMCLCLYVFTWYPYICMRVCMCIHLHRYCLYAGIVLRVCMYMFMLCTFGMTCVQVLYCVYVCIMFRKL